MRRFEGLGRGLRGLGNSNGPTVSANPDFTDLAFTAGGSGVEDNLAATYTYAGNYPLVFRGVTSTVFTPPGADAAAIRSNIIAGTGTGNLEEFAVDPFSGSTLTLVAGQLTASSNSATYIHGFIEEKTNTGFSEIRTVAVSGLDFTVPTITWATNLAGTQLIGTPSETLYETDTVVGNFTMSGHTLTNLAIGATITMDISPSVAAGETDTINYSGGDLRDGRGNPVANITGGAITNNVTTADFFLDSDVAPGAVEATTKSVTLDTSGAAASSTIYVALSIITGSPFAGTQAGTVTIDGNSMTLVSGTRFADSVAFRPAVAIFKATGLTLPASSSVVWTGNGTDEALFFAAAAFCVPASTTDSANGAYLNSSFADPIVVSQNVATGNYVIQVLAARDFLLSGLVGLTDGGSFLPSAERTLAFGYAENVAAATPRVMEFDLDSSAGTAYAHARVVITV
jgi:hypothetical protein